MEDIIEDSFNISSLFIENKPASPLEIEELKKNFDSAIAMVKEYGTRRVLPESEYSDVPQGFLQISEVEKMGGKIIFGKNYYTNPTNIGNDHSDFFVHVLGFENVQFIHYKDKTVTINVTNKDGSETLSLKERISLNDLTEAEFKLENKALKMLLVKPVVQGKSKLS